MNESDIKAIIENEVDVEINKSKLIKDLIFNKEKILKCFYSFYQIFKNIRANNIKHCILYIGEESATEYEENIKAFAYMNQFVKIKDLIVDDIYINLMIKKSINNLRVIKKEYM